MLAVLELGGNQFIVREGDIIDVKKVDSEINSIITTEALLVSDEDGANTQVGSPLVAGSKIELKVVDQFKGEKVRVFKMKSKKRHMKNNGFRPHLTKLEVLSIG